MVKNYLFLILSLILSLPVLGQNNLNKNDRHHLLSKQLKNRKHSSINIGERISYFKVNNKQKSSLKYKVDKKKKLDSIIKISTGISDYGSKFIYNSDGYLTTETTIYRENSDKWNICCKYEYSYNDERNVILKILNFWNQNDNQWGAPKYKEEYIYNTQGNLAKMLKYDGGVNEEDLHSTYEYSYNSEEKLISISQYAGNSYNFRD
jgi:hypothetical protein